jgi:capsular polysaccharide biosynthesis protein
VKKLLVRAITASLLIAAVVFMFSATRTPTYEASALVLVGQKELSDGKGGLIPLAPAPETLQALIQPMIIAIDTRPVAEETIRRLGLELSPDQLLNNLSIEQIESSQFIRLTYTDTDAARSAQVVNTVSQVSAERISKASATANNITATVYEKAEDPSHRASPHPLRNGVLTLVAGLMLCAGTALARTAGRAEALGSLGGRHSIVERVKEKKLLRALGQRGKLTAVEAALETSLTVEEANRILFELAARGHLKVTVGHGGLLYSFWGEDEA